jgi:transposase
MHPESFNRRRSTLVPRDQLLRKINETIDFSFIAEKCRPLYCEDNGRPCIDPVMLFKMLLIGYLYGIRSERRLIKEIRVGFIEGKQLFTDSTFLKANASKNKFKKQKVTVTPKDYMGQLEKVINEDWIQHDKKPFKKNESSQKKEKFE